MLIVLLVEDNHDHAEMVKRCFAKSHIDNQTHHVADGEEALDYLFRRNKYSDPDKSPKPDIILLDLRMPKLDGVGVLKGMRASDTTRDIPVIVLTTSETDMDKALAFKYMTKGYLVKPFDCSEFQKILEEINLS